MRVRSAFRPAAPPARWATESEGSAPAGLPAAAMQGWASAAGQAGQRSAYSPSAPGRGSVSGPLTEPASTRPRQPCPRPSSSKDHSSRRCTSRASDTSDRGRTTDAGRAPVAAPGTSRRSTDRRRRLCSRGYTPGRTRRRGPKRRPTKDPPRPGERRKQTFRLGARSGTTTLCTLQHRFLLISKMRRYPFSDKESIHAHPPLPCSTTTLLAARFFQSASNRYPSLSSIAPPRRKSRSLWKFYRLHR